MWWICFSVKCNRQGVNTEVIHSPVYLCLTTPSSHFLVRKPYISMFSRLINVQKKLNDPCRKFQLPLPPSSSSNTLKTCVKSRHLSRIHNRRKCLISTDFNRLATFSTCIPFPSPVWQIKFWTTMEILKKTEKVMKKSTLKGVLQGQSKLRRRRKRWAQDRGDRMTNPSVHTHNSRSWRGCGLIKTHTHHAHSQSLSTRMTWNETHSQTGKRLLYCVICVLG